MTLEERVAAAMAKANNDYDGGDLQWWLYIDDARAAIAAVMEHLREVTPEMGRAGQRQSGGRIYDYGVRDIYLAMLETAIK